ncbi:MAG: peptide deformylase [Bacteroidales bacterium]|nr:peptide deformylase [Bacteroidales bacterium]
MQLPIYLYGQQVLRKPTEDITSEYPGISDLVANMYETMAKADGVGLAAPQVGLSIRLFVIDLTSLAKEYPKYKDYKKTFINPKIVEFYQEKCIMEEGCLSLPDIHENVSRSAKIRIRYQDDQFVQHEEDFEDYEARVIQHEYDHLEGKVFTDYISPIRKQLIKSKLTAILKGKSRPYYRVKGL